MNRRVRVIRGANRVLRGGSWINDGRNLRSAYRNNHDPGNRNDNIGFRLARARDAAGGRRIDQTLILSARAVAPARRKASGPRHVSRARGCGPKACRRTSFQPPAARLAMLHGRTRP